jgi:hypothetical protein
VRGNVGWKPVIHSAILTECLKIKQNIYRYFKEDSLYDKESDYPVIANADNGYSLSLSLSGDGTSFNFTYLTIQRNLPKTEPEGREM